MLPQDILVNEVIIPAAMNWCNDDRSYWSTEFELSEPIKCIRYYDPSNKTSQGDNSSISNAYTSDCYLKKMAYLSQVRYLMLKVKGFCMNNISSDSWNKLSSYGFLLMYDQDGNIITENLFTDIDDPYKGWTDVSINDKVEPVFHLKSTDDITISRIEFYVPVSTTAGYYTIVDKDGQEHSFDSVLGTNDGETYMNACTIELNFNLKANVDRYLNIKVDAVKE